jgi:Na+-transporting methylmalonyl-CoA/oxaloacetate decarboxylase gamma subunit
MIVHFDPNQLGLRELTIGERTLTALLGYAVVFAGLLILMALVYCMGIIFKKMAARKKPLPAAPIPQVGETVREPEPIGEPAKGTAGEIKLYDVSDKDAAMIMAIVASQMGKPLNELRFKSIKEVK